MTKPAENKYIGLPEQVTMLVKEEEIQEGYKQDRRKVNVWLLIL